ncbi:MAG TPA: hypothetical protein VH684_01405 [Xanthobacteraceae bacterium]
MRFRSATRALSVAAIAAAAVASAAAAGNAARYPELKGAWLRWFPPDAVRDVGNGGFTAGGQPSHDQTKPWGRGQDAPLTAEYQKVFEESLADQASGGEGNFFDHAVRCMPGGMPIMTVGFGPLEYIVTPDTTYVAASNREPLRRIYTDGRDWPAELDPVPTYAGYSIGRWIDEDGDGIYDVLEVETRGPFKGPRTYDATGLPLAFDNQSVFKERIFRDKADPNILHDEITTFDHALTRPWTVDKKYRHNPNPRPRWAEDSCSESMSTSLIAIGREAYYMSADGLLMPVRKNQPPPDLKYFKKAPQ